MAAMDRIGRHGSDVETGKRRLSVVWHRIIFPDGRSIQLGEMPGTELLEAMTKYNEELVKAGVMLAGDGLHPSSRGARVRFEGGRRTVIDGPFTEAKELVAGYWIWECASREEAIEWVKRAPFDGGVELELRQVAEAEG